MKTCMGTDKRVQILLSTYNGEKYLREQLDSYLNLDCYEVVKVLIRDDGSTDGTCAILKEYEEKYGFDVVYGENLGITDSYMYLLEHSDPSCQYFAFSDQDDVWLPHKLSVAMEHLDKESEDMPVLFASLSRIVDESLQHIGYSTTPAKGISYYNAMIQNVLPGHTQVLNRKLLNEIIDHGYADIHVIDWWCYLIASAIGKVIFSPKATVLYRQHSFNSIGMKKNKFDSLMMKLKYIREGRGNAFSKQLKAFFVRYEDMISPEYFTETKYFFDSMNSIRNRIKYVCSSKTFRQNKLETVMFKILYVFGKYNC